MKEAISYLPEDLEPSMRGTLPGDGALAFARWEHPNPLGRIILLHGYGEHGERYRHTAAWLHRLGWSVSSMDQRGFGRSGGPRGDAEGIRGFVQDFVRFLHQERHYQAALEGRSVAFEGAVPVRPALQPRQVVLAHSFGGLVALLTLLWHPESLDGLVLSSPVVKLRPLTLVERIGQAVLGALAPHWVLNLPSDKHRVCTDPVIAQRFRQDPLCHQRMSAGFAGALLEGSKEVFSHGSGLDRPILLLEAGDDVLADHDGAETFWNSIPEPFLEQHRLDGFRHEVFHDRRRREAQALVENWLTRRFLEP